MITSFIRTMKFALQGFWRNVWLSLVTVVILVLTLLSISMVWGINVVANQAISAVQDKVDVSIFFKAGVAESEIFNIQNRFEALSQVKDVRYITPDQALAQFRQKHANDPDILASLDELKENPLGATLIVRANSLEDYPTILSVLDDPSYKDIVQDKNFEDSQTVINRLSDASQRVQRVGIVISIIFVIIAVLLIFNTIRITIYTHREEIGIMKLVGATNWFIRSPFLVESILYGLMAAIIAFAIFYPFVSVLSPQVSNFFTGYDFNLTNYFHAHFWGFFGFQLLFAVFLSVVSSLIAIGKYLKV